MPMQRDVTLEQFARSRMPDAAPEPLGPGAVLLRAFAMAQDGALLTALLEVAGRSPFRHMTTPGGYRMSVAMTNCGACGWITDETGYRYGAVDPSTDARWPPMPLVFRDVATHRRSDPPRRVPLAHGDVVVWGGPARLRYHGVMPLRDGRHPLLGAFRVNLSLRKAG